MDAESYPFLLSLSLGLSVCFCCSLATSRQWWLEHSLGTWKLNLSRWETTIGSVSPVFFRNALTAKLLYTKQLFSALLLSRFYKMRYETHFCVSRSFKLVPLAVTSGYILSFAYPPVEDKYRWKPPNKISQIEIYQEDLCRFYSGTNIFFFIVEWEFLDE